MVLREETIKSNALVEKFNKQCTEWKERYAKSEQTLNDLQGVEVRYKDLLKHSGELEKEVVRLNDELALAKLDIQRLQQQAAQAKHDLLHLQSVHEDL